MARNIFQKLYYRDLTKVYQTFSGVIFDNIIGDIPDLQNYFTTVHKNLSRKTPILISYHNPLWEPVLSLASKLGLRKKVSIQNWLDQEDVKNILYLSGFEVLSSQTRFFGITTITIAKAVDENPPPHKRLYSISIIIPARNEEGNIGKIVSSIPSFGKRQEIIFVEGNSKDRTWQKITRLRDTYQGPKKIKVFKQKGVGKADAVKLGFEKATGDILMIYDADRTVDAKDLEKFYTVLASNMAKFANGSRLVYPMEHDAMQTLNKIGNKIFGTLFTWTLGTRFKDTLCGTKAMWRHDFVKYYKDYKKYLKIDPFGDFALIFTAIKHKLKVIEIPVRYKERVYGSTNINRFYHGLLLLKMTIAAFKEFKVS